MSNNTIKALIGTLAGLLLISLFLWLYPFPKKIDIEYPAVQFRGHPAEAVEQTTLTLKGVLYRPLFRDERFVGELSIEKYDFTTKYELIDIDFHKNIRNGWGTLSYTKVANGQVSLNTFGDIRKLNQFDKVLISVYEPIGESSKTWTDLVITAPAQSFEEAQDIQEAFRDSSD